MKIKTSELIGSALDWAVAVCEGRKEPELMDNFAVAWFSWGNSHYSTNWAMGGPIIEREQISVVPLYECWEAILDLDEGDAMVELQLGPTPLIAAMRCFCASKLGDEVDVPEELM